MKVIINIDDREYNEIKEDAEKFKSKGMAVPYLYKIILSGTPIPKGHGRIIDETQIVGDGSWDFGDRLEETPAIIEADNTESEE